MDTDDVKNAIDFSLDPTFTMNDLALAIGISLPTDRSQQMRLGVILRKMGYAPKQKRVGAARQVEWSPASTAEIPLPARAAYLEWQSALKLERAAYHKYRTLNPN